MKDRRCHFLFQLLVAALFFGSLGAMSVLAPNLDCDPCIRRPDFVIKAIVHGTKQDPYWQATQSAMEQAARDMKVQFQMELYDNFNPEKMASDISRLTTDSSRVDSLIVTIPSEQVHSAIREAVDSRIPVFGFNSGYDVFESLGVIDFVAQDEYEAGVKAAEEFIRLTRNKDSKQTQTAIQRAVFVNHQKGNQALDTRFRGFQETLLEWNDSIQVEELVVDPNDLLALNDAILEAMQGCPYDVVLTAGVVTAPLILEAASELDCYPGMKIATFDEAYFLQSYILQDKLAFALPQQKYLEAALPVVMASLYATTSAAIVPNLQTKTYLSGPLIVNKDNLPSDTLITCEQEAFPVCPNDRTTSSGGLARCDCFDRSEIRIGGVLHGVSFSMFNIEFCRPIELSYWYLTFYFG